MANVELNIVALGDFSSVNAGIKSLQEQVALLQKNLSGVGLNATLTKDLAGMQAQFKQTMLSAGQFTQSTVAMTSETERFGTALAAGKLKLTDYYNIIRQKTSEAVTQVKALAIEQTKLQNSIVMNDPSKQGILSVYTPTQIDKVSNATRIAANEANLYAIAVQKGSQALTNWGKNTQWAGRQLTVGMSVPLMIFGQQATSAFTSVNTELTRLQRLYGEGLKPPSQAELDQISGQVLQLGKQIANTMGIAQTETVKTAANFAAMGKQGQDLLNITMQAERLSKLGGIDTNQSTNAIVALQNVYRVSTTNLADAVNFLSDMQKQTTMSLSDMTDAIPRVGPIMQQLGGSYKDTAVMLLAMKEAGVPAAQAANALKSAFASIIAPTSAATQEFSKFGINLSAVKNAGTPVQMIEKLQEGLKGLTPLVREQLIEKLFGKFQFARVSALLDNFGRIGSQTQNALKVAGATSSQLADLANQEMKQATSSPTAKYQRALETFKADLVPVGQKILEFATKLMNFGNAVANVFGKLPGPVKTVMGAIAIGVVLAGPIIMLTGLMANFIGFLVKGIFNIKQLATGGKTLGQLLTPELVAAQNASRMFNDDMLNNVSSVDLLAGAIDKLTISINGMVKALDVGTGVDGLVQTIGAVATTEASVYTQMHLPGFNSGTTSVPGSGNEDNYPALLTPGEAVIPADKARMYGPFISAMIDGTLPRHRSGTKGYATTLSEDHPLAGVVSALDAKEQAKAIQLINAEESKLLSTTAKIGDSLKPAALVEMRKNLKGAIEDVQSSGKKLTSGSLGTAYRSRSTALEDISDPTLRSYFAGKGVTEVPAVGFRAGMNANSSSQMQFGHVGSGVQMSASDMLMQVKSGAIELKGKALTDLEELVRKSPDSRVGIKSGLGYDMAGKYNNVMHPGKGGANLGEFVDDYKAGGAGKWDQSLVHAGVNPNDPTVLEAKKAYDDAMVQELENLKEKVGPNFGIMDSDITQIEASVREKIRGIYPAFASIVDKAEKTITEIRVDGGNRLGGSSPYSGRVAGGWGASDMLNAEAMALSGKNAVDEILVSAKKEGRINSPSELFSEEVGVPIGQGIQKGFQETLPGMENMLSTSMQDIANTLLAEDKQFNLIGATIPEALGKGIVETTPEALAIAKDFAMQTGNAINTTLEEEAVKTRGIVGRIASSKMGLASGMMGVGMVGGMIGGSAGSALGTAGSLAGMAGMMAPKEYAAEVMAGVFAVSLLYSGVSKLIEMEKQHQAAADSAYQTSDSVMSQYKDGIDKVNSALSSTADYVNAIPATKNVTVNINQTTSGSTAGGGLSPDALSANVKRIEALDKSNVERLNFEGLRDIGDGSGNQQIAFLTKLAKAQAARGGSQGDVTSYLSGLAQTAGQGFVTGDRLNSAIAAVFKGGQQKAITDTVSGQIDFVTNDTLKGFAQSKDGMTIPGVSYVDSQQARNEAVNSINDLITNKGQGQTFEMATDITQSKAKRDSYINALANTSYNKAPDIVTDAMSRSTDPSMQNLARQLQTVGASGKTLADKLRLVNENTVIGQTLMNSSWVAKGKEITMQKEFIAWQEKNAAALKAGTIATGDFFKQNKDWATWADNWTAPIPPGSSSSSSSSSTNDGTVVDPSVALQNKYKTLIDQQNKHIAYLDKLQTAMDRVNTLAQNQLSYATKQTDIQNQITQAMASGDYLKANLLRQDAAASTDEFNRQSITNSNKSALDDAKLAMSDFQDTISQGLNPTAAQIQALKNVQKVQLGTYTQATMNSPAAVALAKGASTMGSVVSASPSQDTYLVTINAGKASAADIAKALDQLQKKNGASFTIGGL